ncbi:hypothetical protein ACLVWU_10095 [Bdellovibrio sp. HCB290]|uniref:hypothetical protein n=1 Tax=Bdellovibrio sp. HCB290 TaxID=3394356 RepID=UPI0039B3D59C
MKYVVVGLFLALSTAAFAKTDMSVVKNVSFKGQKKFIHPTCEITDYLSKLATDYTLANSKELDSWKGKSKYRLLAERGAGQNLSKLDFIFIEKLKRNGFTLSRDTANPSNSVHVRDELTFAVHVFETLGFTRKHLVRTDDGPMFKPLSYTAGYQALAFIAPKEERHRAEKKGQVFSAETKLFKGKPSDSEIARCYDAMVNIALDNLPSCVKGH